MSTKKNIADGVQKRSIRDIPMPNNHGTFTKKKKTRTTKTSTSKPPRDFSRFALWSIVVISVVILGFAISSFFGGATVRITPKTQTVALNNTVTFAAGTSTPEYLVMEISDSTNREVVAEGDEYVETKAVGKIVIYNTHSTSPQTLIEQTRFESPEGYIYRIQEEVSVPGQKVVDGKTVPGQLEVTVIADKAGEKYNISPTDFTIPGFKGDSRFETFFARSQTEMTGGFMGTQKVISTEQQAQVENELQKELEEVLQNELEERISDDKILLEESVVFEYTDITQQESEEEGMVLLVQTGSIRAIVVEKRLLAARLATQIPLNNTVPVVVNNSDDLSITLENAPFSLSTNMTVPISVTVQGDAQFEWSVDLANVRETLAGQSRNSLSELLSIYEGIERATATISPFWSSTFPYEAEEIEIVPIVHK